MSRRRRGRPRKDRLQACKKRQGDEDFRPTERQRQIRLALVGPDHPLEWADYPLGVLRARGYITAQQHDAACRYAALYRVALVGTGTALHPAVSNLTGRQFDGPENREEAWLATRALRYREARDLLQAHGRRTRQLVEDISVYERLPGFCLTKRFLRPGERYALERLCAGLDALATLFGRTLQDAA